MGTNHTENRQSKSAHQHSCNAYVAVVPVGSKNRTRPSFDAADSYATEVHIFGGNSWGSRPMFWRIAELRQCTRVRPTQGGRSEWQSLSRSCSWRHPSVELADPRAMRRVATPTEKIAPASSGTPAAAAAEESRSFWPLSLSDIETYLYRIVRPEPKTEAKAEPRSRQPSERPTAEQPR